MIIFAIILFIFIGIMTVGWSVHISQNKAQNAPYGYASFACFLREYKKREWERCAEYRRSHFTEKWKDGYIHASIIIFDNKAMIMNYWSYYPYSFWILFNLYMGNKYKYGTGNTVKWGK